MKKEQLKAEYSIKMEMLLLFGISQLLNSEGLILQGRKEHL